MNHSLYERLPLIGGLLTGAIGIAALWAGGVDFPVAIPPGIVILGLGALLVAAVRATWTAWVGCALGIFVLVGFIVAGINGDGFRYLLGREGAVVALGQAVELIGVVVAAVSGFRVARPDHAQP